jgi:hypothetical protein
MGLLKFCDLFTVGEESKIWNLEARTKYYKME